VKLIWFEINGIQLTGIGYRDHIADKEADLWLVVHGDQVLDILDAHFFFFPF
jgi:hypothetical protein